MKTNVLSRSIKNNMLTLLALLAIYVAVCGSNVYMEYTSYEKNIDRVAYVLACQYDYNSQSDITGKDDMAGKDDMSLTNVIDASDILGLLKDGKSVGSDSKIIVANEDYDAQSYINAGREILQKYGYIGDGPDANCLYAEFRKKVITQAIELVVGIMVIWAIVVISRKISLRDTEREFEKLECILEGFRDEKNLYSDIAWQGEAGHRLTAQLDSLRNYLRILKEEARLEREGTKSLVSDISHQLKTPVAALDASFTLLQSDQLSDEERAEFTDRCRASLDGLENLLQSLVQISRMEAGVIQLDMKEMPLMDTILNAVNSVYSAASDKNIDVECNTTDADNDAIDYAMEKFNIYHDTHWLAEAIINVLDNAVKYSPNGSKIEIGVCRRNGLVRITISDHGIGILKEEYHKIFQRFYRGGSEEVRNAEGSGIGLFLARKIVEMHGGTITVSSEYGSGSTFVIQLPENVP